MRFFVLLLVAILPACSWMPDLYPREETEVAVPLAPAPSPELAPAPTLSAPAPAQADQAQQVVAPQYQQQFAPDALTENQQQYQQQQQQQFPQAVAPMQPQYYYAVPIQPQVLPPQYQQPYYQQPVPLQPQFYAPQPMPAPPAAPLLGQPMPHSFTTGKQYLQSDIQTLPGEDDFPPEYGYVKPAGESKAQYLKRDDVTGQQTQIQPSAPPIMGRPQQQPTILQGR